MPYKCRFCGKTVKSPWSCNQGGCGKSAGAIKFEAVEDPTASSSTTTQPPQSTPRNLNPQTLGTLVSGHVRANVQVVTPTRPQPNSTPTSRPQTSTTTSTPSTGVDSKEQKRTLVEEIKVLLGELEKRPGTIDSADYTRRVRPAVLEPGTVALEAIRDELQVKNNETKAIFRELVNALQELKQLAPTSSKLIDFADRAKTPVDNTVRSLLVTEIKNEVTRLKQPQSTTTQTPQTTTPPTTTTTRPSPSLQDALSEIRTLSPAELRNKSIGEKVDMLTPIVDQLGRYKTAINQIELQLEDPNVANRSQLEQRLAQLKQNRDEGQKVCNKLYKVTSMDEQFRRNDIQQRQTYLTALSNNPHLRDASVPENWIALTNDEKKDLMQSALNEQFRVLSPGATPPPIELKYWPDDEPDQDKVQQAEDSGTLPQGYYDPNVHKIIFWVYRRDGDDVSNKEKGPLKDFKEAIDTAIHETSHAYQNELVKQLNEVEAGTRMPPPPKAWEVEQAKLFRLNQIAYEDGGLDRDAYLKEPLEIHAWLAGGTAAMLFDYDSAVMDLQRKINDVVGWFPDRKRVLTELLSGVRGQSRNLAEKGPEVLKLLEAAERLEKEIPKVRKQPEDEFRKQDDVISKHWEEFKIMDVYVPLHARFIEMNKKYLKLWKEWQESLKTGPLSAVQLGVTNLKDLTSKVGQLLELATAHTTCQSSISNLTKVINQFDSSKFTSQNWTEYKAIRKLYDNFRNSSSEFAEASNLDGLKSLNTEVLQVTTRANLLPQKV
jgi:hypothetical protein